MKLLEVKNNLIKMSYNNDEVVVLAEFIAVVESSKSYVAQIVNLKADATNKYAIAKLIFTFNEEGMVDNYDGSIPSVNAKISVIEPKDILKLMPLERPVIIGKLAQQDDILKLDETIFENNLTICAEKFEHISTIVKNFVSQINEVNGKIIVIDTDHNFVECEPLRFKKDFKLPLNNEMISYIYNNDLTEIEPTSKALLQEIFLSVQEYAKTAEDGFIPFSNFLDVINQQYQETSMPELALLKNKLLKYEEENIFAQTKDDIETLGNAIQTRNNIYIDISDAPDNLQRELICYIHKIADSIETYIYNFVKLTNNNSDKKLLKQLLVNEHIFTNIICGHNYKYVSELKQRADNLILFAPQTVQHDFANYNTLLNKLNPNEFIAYGELTQNVPFVVELTDLQEILAEENTEEEAFNTFENTFTDEEEKDISQKADDFIQEMDTDQFDITENENLDSESFQEDMIFENPDEISDFLPENTQQTESVDNEPQVFVNEEIEENILDDDQTEFPNIGEDFIEENEEEILEEEPLSTEEIPIEDIPNDQVQDLADTETEEQEQEQVQVQVQDQQDTLPDMEEYETEEANDDDENLPVYPSEETVSSGDNIIQFEQGDTVTNAKYGKGVIQKIIKYGNKTLCSIAFEEAGKRLLDPTVSELQKLS